jgi:hypothetical protein
MATEKTQKNSLKYICEKCNFISCNKNDYTRHISTVKHARNAIATFSNQEKLKPQTTYSCKNCNKQYNDRSGLWRHVSKCILVETTPNFEDNNNNNSNDDIIQLLLKQNNDLIKEQADIKQIILEIVKNGTISCNNNNTNIINSNNKTFNLQVFLNETCKDAMNISEFIESVKLQVSDLENVGKVGYIEGISNIIIKNLQALEVEKRPVHCTDQKREVMYVKEDNIWEKEDESNKRLRKLVRAIAHKNICMLKAFRDKYPDCEQYDSKKGSQYNKLVIEAMGGKGDNDYEKNTKIIKKIAKAVGIDKN